MPQDPRVAEKEQREAWKTAPLAELVNHIVQRYHLEARVEIARLETFTEQAMLQEGRHDPILRLLRDQVARLGTEMRAHLTQEEREVFPAILEMAAGRSSHEAGALLATLKKALEDEHDAEAGMFRHIRMLNEEFQAGAQAVGVKADIAESLKALAASLQQHIFLENQILFRRES